MIVQQCISHASPIDIALDKFAAAMTASDIPEDHRPAIASGLCGRIIRGKCEADFSTLTDNPHRKIVFIFGPDALSRIPGLAGEDVLYKLAGATPKYILDNFGPDSNGRPMHKCKLIVFPENQGARVATWNNLLNLASKVYPQFTSAFEEARRPFELTDFREFEFEFNRRYGVTFKHVDNQKHHDPRFMTEDRFAKSLRSPFDTRAFLYFSMGVRELYSGDGRTRSEDGSIGPLEYVIPNLEVKQLHHRMIDIPVDTSRLRKIVTEKS